MKNTSRILLRVRELQRRTSSSSSARKKEISWTTAPGYVASSSSSSSSTSSRAKSCSSRTTVTSLSFTRSRAVASFSTSSSSSSAPGPDGTPGDEENKVTTGKPCPAHGVVTTSEVHGGSPRLPGTGFAKNSTSSPLSDSIRRRFPSSSTTPAGGHSTGTTGNRDHTSESWTTSTGSKSLSQVIAGTNAPATPSSTSSSGGEIDDPLMNIRQSRLEELLDAERIKFSLQIPPQLTLMKILAIPERDYEFALRSELPKRIAVRIKLIESLPGWQLQKNLRHVRNIYDKSFRSLRLLQRSGQERTRNDDDGAHAKANHHSTTTSSNTKSSPEETDELVSVIQQMKHRHGQITPHVIAGIAEMKAAKLLSVAKVDEFMSRFFKARIGTECLTTHFLAMWDNEEGIIDRNADLHGILLAAAEDATEVCQLSYPKLEPPRIMIRSHGEQVRNVPLVPEYLHYACFELLKNSLRAVIEWHKDQCVVPPVGVSEDEEQDENASAENVDKKKNTSAANNSRQGENGTSNDDQEVVKLSGGDNADCAEGHITSRSRDRAVQGKRGFGIGEMHYEEVVRLRVDGDEIAPIRWPSRATGGPPITVDVCCDRDTVTVRISDEGGGIPRDQIDKIWSYLFTTAKPVTNFGDRDDEIVPMAGFGCGLPLTKEYVNWVGGRIELVSLPTFGTDVYLSLARN
ncbi:unnamed protein product [Amoebophrya sp. A25]|nr:unnamed protein product [Amoebophrya sp. A25]|eukprot:GSA25T00006641001.1